MSKFHGEQYWNNVRQQTLQNWRDLSEDDFDTLRAICHDREIRERGMRDRFRHEQQTVRREDLDS